MVEQQSPEALYQQKELVVDHYIFQTSYETWIVSQLLLLMVEMNVSAKIEEFPSRRYHIDKNGTETDSLPVLCFYSQHRGLTKHFKMPDFESTTMNNKT